MEELFRLMETWPDWMLENVQRGEKWTSGWPVKPDGSRCLIGQAMDATDEYNQHDQSWSLLYRRFEEAAGMEFGHARIVWALFDGVCTTQGDKIDATGRECSARAAEILAARRAQKVGARDVVSVG